ncbi:MAG: hypothetical protein GVY32_04345 [Gammaproteobacteria bacterium]|jgi:uroporphyrin-3 C-methyltransferase|nr:hypothetical protein [Gammaproteobacteria bacterium]
MNDRQDASDAEEPEAASNAGDVSDSTEATESGSEERPESPDRGRSGVGLSLVALLLALAAFGASGWLWWESRQTSQASPVDEIRSQVGVLGERMDRLEARSAELDALADRLSGLEALSDRVARVEDLPDRVDSLQNRLQDLSGRIESTRSRAGADASELQTLNQASEALAARVSDLEQSLPEQLSELRDALSSNRQQQTLEFGERVAERRRELVLLEVSGLLRLGQSRAELAGDLAGARAAYVRAAERLATLQNGGFDRVGALIAEEREALEELDPPDWAGIMAQLQDLDAEAAEWPMKGAASSTPAPAGESDPAGEPEGWWPGMRRALGGLVQVSERDDVALPGSAVESIRERIRLHLAAAQAAAARRAAVELARQVTAVADLLEARFDTDASPVSRALDMLDELSGVREPELPPLGEALAELQDRQAAP